MVDAIATDTKAYAERWAALGRRKVAAMMRADGYTCSESRVFRSLVRQGG